MNTVSVSRKSRIAMYYETSPINTLDERQTRDLTEAKKRFISLAEPLDQSEKEMLKVLVTDFSEHLYKMSTIDNKEIQMSYWEIYMEPIIITVIDTLGESASDTLCEIALYLRSASMTNVNLSGVNGELSDDHHKLVMGLWEVYRF